MLYLICPVFGRLEYTLSCLDSIEKFLDQEYQIIICDDHPLYDTYKYFEKNIRQNVIVVKGTGNLYWGGGINFLLDYISSSFQLESFDKIVFFNNDILLISPVPKVLFEIASLNGIVHPRLINHHNQSISAGGNIRSWLPYRTLSDHKLIDLAPLISVDFASARFLVIDPAVIAALGGIDRRLPHYAGDNDFVLRAKGEGFKPVIFSDWNIQVAELDSGIKIDNSPSIIEFIKSFWSIKSPNCLKYRWRFVRNHKNFISSILIVFSMTIKSFLGYTYYLLKPRNL